ncbi:hypothetical protein HRbin16_03020 [bacterium HR16]|nr:hypothetical protein HRbin16_03020 [bacterium HR16]
MTDDPVHQWLTKAEHDLKIARDELATEEPVTDMVSFHAQQACEKCLKAFLIFHGKEYPRTHDLSDLIARCEAIDAEFALLAEWGVDELTDYSVSVRYGEPFEMPSLSDAQEALVLAERVLRFVKDRM